MMDTEIYYPNCSEMVGCIRVSKIKDIKKVLREFESSTDLRLYTEHDNHQKTTKTDIDRLVIIKHKNKIRGIDDPRLMEMIDKKDYLLRKILNDFNIYSQSLILKNNKIEFSVYLDSYYKGLVIWYPTGGTRTPIVIASKIKGLLKRMEKEIE